MARNEIPENMYNLSISGLGIDVDRMIDGQTLAGIMALVMGADKTVADVTASTGASAPSTDGVVVKVSLREFLDEVRATRKPDQIVAIGHYITQFQGQADFSRDEVKAQFSVAREPMPANFPRDFALAVRAGMLAEVHGKQGRYYVTKTGLGAMKSKFSKDKDK